jgi:trans-aconitate 2-methyltransferase
MTMQWDPQQYLSFSDHRLRPAIDLLARVPAAAPALVYDLGCGAGNVTALLRRRWPQARVIGIDSSEAMLEKARQSLPEGEFRQADLATWQPEAAADVIFTNAALHWLPDHDALFPRLFGGLGADGVLAVQMPRNFAAPSHRHIHDTIMDGPWRERLAPLWRDAPVQPPAHYHRLLAPQATVLDIFEVEYLQRLTGVDPVKEWTKGTWLKPFLDALPEGERADFEEGYAARLREAYPPEADGATLFPFRRLFIVAVRG